MGQPIVHFEVIGKDPEKLRTYYGELFGWEFDTSALVAEAVSQSGNYGFVNRNTTSDGTGIPGGVGGGKAYDAHVIFYVGVPDVEAALRKAESLGGTRRLGPGKEPGGRSRGRTLHGPGGQPDRRCRAGVNRKSSYGSST
jgi:predicted enzyme related to lactoylglutathione lyase